eukprot:2727507-Rhodomonas_salina.3
MTDPSEQKTRHQDKPSGPGLFTWGETLCEEGRGSRAKTEVHVRDLPPENQEQPREYFTGSTFKFGKVAGSFHRCGTPTRFG